MKHKIVTVARNVNVGSKQDTNQHTKKKVKQEQVRCGAKRL